MVELSVPVCSGSSLTLGGLNLRFVCCVNAEQQHKVCVSVCFLNTLQRGYSRASGSSKSELCVYFSYPPGLHGTRVDSMLRVISSLFWGGGLNPFVRQTLIYRICVIGKFHLCLVGHNAMAAKGRMED